MTEFDPEKFEDKYANYFPELQRAYKAAFETMNDTYDSELVHAIDQQILNESEPVYVESGEESSADESSGQRADGDFRIELPEDPVDRLDGVVADEEKVEALLDRYVAELRAELRSVFGFE